MSIIYVTGGAKSGKSKFAEELLLSLNNGKQKNVYLATSLIYDEEMEMKVALHRERREDKWITVESYKNFPESLKNVFAGENLKLEGTLARSEDEDIVEDETEKTDAVINLTEESIADTKNNILVDCLTNMISNIIFENEGIDWDKPTKNQLKECDMMVEKEVEGLLKVSYKFENMVVVSNELGMGIVPDNPLGRYFREIAGRMNQLVAEAADEVYFVVSGIPMKMK